MIPGEFFIANKEINCNIGRKTITLKVANTGDRPIQVGSHFHFFETNKYLDFDREKAFGMRLNIPSGTATRFEPGEEKTVCLVEIGGNKKIYGLNALTGGHTTDEKLKSKCLEKAKKLNFKGVS